MDGLFITFEGIDLSGKSTQVRLLSEKIQLHNYEVVLLREPGGTPISDKIRKILLDPENANLSEISELLLYEASRAQLTIEKIIPALKKGEIVICDRFADSTLAYQGYGRGIRLSHIRNLNRIATFNIKPSITFILDVPVVEAMERRKKRSETDDRIEGEAIAFHERVRKGYMRIAKEESDRVIVINAKRALEEIHKDIWDTMEQRFPSYFF